MKCQSIVGTSKGRPENDFYPTPENAVYALLEKEIFSGSILEPACGDGAISKALLNKGLKNVTSRDLINRGYGKTGCDFLACKDSFDNIITNPPYILAQKFVEKSLSIANHKVALLLKLNFLEGIKRQKMFKNTPLARVYVFSKRLSMYRNGETMKNSGMIAFAWFVWEQKYKESVIINWV